MNENRNFPCSELEEQLASPQGASVQASYLSRLHALEARIHAYLKAGPCQRHYATSNVLANAVEAAITVIKNYPISKPATDPNLLSVSSVNKNPSLG